MTDAPGLTLDNTHLSEASQATSSPSRGVQLIANPAIDCLRRVETFVADSLAPNTKRAYLCDLEHFRSWGADLPASPETLASYLAAHADTLSVATMVRRMASISKAHKARGFANPASAELVRATMRGIKRTRGAHSDRPNPSSGTTSCWCSTPWATASRTRGTGPCCCSGSRAGCGVQNWSDWTWPILTGFAKVSCCTCGDRRPTRRGTARRSASRTVGPDAARSPPLMLGSPRRGSPRGPSSARWIGMAVFST